MSLQAGAIITAIAGLSISGVTIKDDNSIPADVTNAGLPLFCPRPNGFISNLKTVRNSQNAAVTKYTVTYTLTYRLFYAPVGSGSGITTIYSDMVNKVFVILDTVLANNAINAAIDFTLRSVSDFGAVTDAVNHQFWGCDFTFDVMEFVD